MSREYGWTTIKNRAYATSKGDSPDGLDLMLARSKASVPLDAAWVEQENARYFAGRRERNAQRAQAMANKAVLAQLADVMNEIEQLKRQLACATEQFNTFTEPSDAPCHVERYALQRACGLREEAR
jgi:hypothetical protein